MLFDNRIAIDFILTNVLNLTQGESMSLLMKNNEFTNENLIINPTKVDVLDQRQAYPGASDQYSVITTRDVLEMFVSKGFTFERMWEQKYRKNSRQGFGKHALRLRHKDITFGQGINEELIPQFYLWNSYDRSMRFVLLGGCFRAACSNTNAWGTHMFEPLRILHKNIDFSLLTGQIDDAVVRLQKTSETIVDLKNIILTSDQKYDYAERMAKVRLGNNPDIAEVLNFRELVDTVRRPEDRSDSAWHVANRVQENLLSNDNAINLTYTTQTVINDKQVALKKTTKSLRSEWVKNKVNLAVFDVLKDVVDNKESMLVAA